ncbi:hypothetical protein EVG20_g10580, partial [Dentipellis fragilis]
STTVLQDDAQELLARGEVDEGQPEVSQAAEEMLRQPVYVRAAYVSQVEKLKVSHLLERPGEAGLVAEKALQPWVHPERYHVDCRFCDVCQGAHRSPYRRPIQHIEEAGTSPYWNRRGEDGEEDDVMAQIMPKDEAAYVKTREMLGGGEVDVPDEPWSAVNGACLRHSPKNCKCGVMIIAPLEYEHTLLSTLEVVRAVEQMTEKREWLDTPNRL